MENMNGSGNSLLFLFPYSNNIRPRLELDVVFAHKAPEGRYDPTDANSAYFQFAIDSKSGKMTSHSLFVYQSDGSIAEHALQDGDVLVPLVHSWLFLSPILSLVLPHFYFFLFFLFFSLFFFFSQSFFSKVAIINVSQPEDPPLMASWKSCPGLLYLSDSGKPPQTFPLLIIIFL
jgi:hypothetical protein